MSLPTIAGAVNGVPVTRNLVLEGNNTVTLNVPYNGIATTLDVDTDGEGFDPDAVNHRVAIIGGTTLATDFFPFPVAALTGGTIYPIAMPLSAIATMFFRVYKWRIYGSLSSSGGTPSFDWIATMGDDISADIGEQASTITNEYQLVNSPFMDSGDDIDGTNASVYEVGMFIFQASTAARYSSGNFYPAFLARVYTDSGIGTVLDTRSPSVSNPIVSAVDATLIIDGNDYPFDFYVDSTFAGGVSGTFTVEASEYWPYATRNGDPVYDTGDGSVVNDPLS